MPFTVSRPFRGSHIDEDGFASWPRPSEGDLAREGGDRHDAGDDHLCDALRELDALCLEGETMLDAERDSGILLDPQGAPVGRQQVGRIVAGIAALEDLAHQDQSRAHNDMWLPWFMQELTKLGLEIVPSVANFVLIKFPESGPKSAAAANAFLNKRGIIARPVANYGLPHHIRITIGTEPELRDVIQALSDFLT